MGLTTMRFIGLWIAVAASAMSMFLSPLGQLLLLCLLVLSFLALGRSSDTEKDDLKPDLIRIALAWKTFGKGNAMATILSWFAAILIFLIQVSQGKLLLDPIRALLFFALNGFCAGAVYYLLFQWTADLRQLETCTETQLLNAAGRERRVVREFNLLTLPYRFVSGYEL